MRADQILVALNFVTVVVKRIERAEDLICVVLRALLRKCAIGSPQIVEDHRVRLAELDLAFDLSQTAAQVLVSFDLLSAFDQLQGKLLGILVLALVHEQLDLVESLVILPNLLVCTSLDQAHLAPNGGRTLPFLGLRVGSLRRASAG